MSGGQQSRRKARRASAQSPPNGKVLMTSSTSDKKSSKFLWLGIVWACGLGVLVTLVASAGALTRLRVLVLTVFGVLFFSIAVYLHGWTRSLVRAARVFAVIVAVTGIFGWQALPSPRAAVIEMRISPSGFPISIPAYSTISILRLHPYIALTDAEDYLIKDENTQGKEFLWPSQAEIDSKDPKDYETAFRVEVTNHTGEALVSGKLLFQVVYREGLSGGGCMPPEPNSDHQRDFILLPQMDPGKTFEFYVVNQSSLCAWLIPPEAATIRMVSDDTERQVALTLDKNPLYAAGAPSFPPTKIKWDALPIRPGGYQIQRIVH